jgi:hypothetical protein
METEKMTNNSHRYFGLTPWVAALALLLATDVLAQAPSPRITVAYGEDMRLWSFGECDRRFPYVETDEHKECVRAVGSPEARDARALNVCEKSHATDLAEIERCKAVYQSNKERAAREGVAVRDLEAPSPEIMRRVKAISGETLEDTPALPRLVPPPAVPRQSEPAAVNDPTESPAVSAMDVILLVIGALALGAGFMRRKTAQSA